MIRILKMTERAKYQFYQDTLDQRTFDKLVKIYPKFDRWIVEAYVRLVKEYGEDSREVQTFWEDTDQLQEYLEIFEKAKNKRMLPSGASDLMRLKTVDELKDLVLPLKGDILGSDEEKEGGQAQKVYEKDGWLIVIPEDEQASCRYGANTQWCTASTKSNNLFQRYNDRGPLYIIINKNTNRKWQFHPASESFMDQNDNFIELYEYSQFPIGVMKALDRVGASPWSTKVIMGIKALIKDTIELLPSAFSEKYRYIFEEPDALFYEDVLGDQEVDVKDIISDEGVVEIENIIQEQMFMQGDYLASDYGYDNPEEFLDEEPEEVDEDGDPVWSEDQRVRAAEIEHDGNLEEAIQEELELVMETSLFQAYSFRDSINQIITDTDFWDNAKLAEQLQLALNMSDISMKRFYDYLESYMDLSDL